MSAPEFDFHCDLLPDAGFIVLSFDGTQALSSLYRFDIQLKLPTPGAVGPDPETLVGSKARLVMRHDGRVLPVHGELLELVERQVALDHTVYDAVLVPRLWRLTLYRTNEMFVKKGESAPDGGTGATEVPNNAVSIAEDVLKAAGFNDGVDFDLSGVTGRLMEREFVCQFRESDFDFVARLLEAEGIAFYFEQEADHERLVAFDAPIAIPLDAGDLLFDAAPTGDAVFRSVNAWSAKTTRIANAVSVRDYDPAQPSLDISSVYPDGAAEPESDYLYGERSIDSDEAARIARLRYELLDSNRTRYYGESGICELRPGRILGFSGHPRSSYDGPNHLLVEVEHRGRDLDAAGRPTPPGHASSRQPQYSNSFVAMPANKPFRPPLRTPKPRFHGTMTAFVYAETGSDRAEVDAYGRYRVMLPFDRAGGPAAETTTESRKATYWVRMMQGYVGADAGTQFPLKAGTEVLLTFINGDPDNPVIVGAVPNARTPSLLTADTADIATISTTDLLSIRADGGAHFDLSVESTEPKSRAARQTQAPPGLTAPDDFAFPRFASVNDTNARTPVLDAGAVVTMSAAGEKDGTSLIEREYGDRHQYQDGDTYTWGHRNANVYDFGPSYEEIHRDVHPEDLSTLDVLKTTTADMTDSATFDRADRAAGRQVFTFPYPTGAGGVGPEDDYGIWGVASMTKLWGDVFEYHHGQTYQWAHNSNKTFSYGNGYSEAHVNISAGTTVDSTHTVQSFNGSGATATNIDYWLHTKPNPVLINKAVNQTLHDIGMQGGGHTGLAIDVGRKGTVDFDPKAALIEKSFGTTYDYHNGLEISVHEGLTVSRNYGDTDERTIGDTYVRYVGSTEESFRGDAKRLFWGFSNDLFMGESAEFKLGSYNEAQLSNAFSLHVGGKQDIFLGGSITVNIALGLELQLTKIKSNVTDLKAKVTTIEAEVNKIGALTTKVDGCVNNIDQVVNAIAASSTDIAISGLTIIS